jgi:UDPglucose 6-dehydrogenase
MPKIAIIGSGYVGVVTAACLAKAGNQVVAYDIDKSKIDQLTQGKLPFYEEKLPELILVQQQKNLTFTSDIKIALSGAEACFIAVSTPHDKVKNCPNLEYFYSATNDVLNNLTQDLLIINKSTLPIGTAKELQNLITQKSLNYRVSVASNPEFLSQGRAVDDFLYPQRIVFGVEKKQDYDLLCNIYQGFINNKVEVVKTNIASAELIKYAANSFLATKVAFINEISQISTLLGANIADISHAMGLDNRIGNKFLQAGPGYGGSCFPKDTKALALAAEQLALDLPIISNIDHSNNKLIDNITNKIYHIIQQYSLNDICFLGMSFKVGTDDIRDSQAIKIIKKLLKLAPNIQINIHDPQALENAINALSNQQNITPVKNLANLANQNVYCIVTAWPEYKEFIEKTDKKAIIIDLRDIKLTKAKNYFKLGYNF